MFDLRGRFIDLVEAMRPSDGPVLLDMAKFLDGARHGKGGRRTFSQDLTAPTKE